MYPFRTVFTVILTTFALNSTAQTTYPAPAAADVSQFGKNIQRTMTLLATSTPQHRNTVKILFYGQSITKQEWSLQTGRWLMQQYPNANIIISNMGIGGFASDWLSKLVEHDIASFYPDLVILYDYMTSFPTYDSIVTRIRSRTAAEVATQDNHWNGDNSWDTQCQNHLATLVVPNKTEFIRQRDPWKAYCLARGWTDGQQLTLDGTHLNAWGSWLMTEFVKRYLRYDATFPKTPWQDLSKDYVVGTDVSFSNGKITIPFNGNRIDLIASIPAGNAAKIRVLIDGKKPSEFPGCYNITRPNGYLGADWWSDSASTTGKDWPWNIGSCVVVNSNAAMPRAEDWTLTLTSINSTDYSNVGFSVSGSVTGADGTGTSTANFTSPSGRVVIRAADWYLKNANSVLGTTFAVGYQIKWKVTPMFSDTFTAPSFTDTTVEHAVTVAQGFPNQGHTLELTAIGTGPIPLKAVRIYRPLLSRGPAVGVTSPTVVMHGIVTEKQAAALYDQRGRLIGAAAARHASRGIYVNRIGVHSNLSVAVR